MPSLKPEVGMGATGGAGSDCYPFTVVEVVNDRKVVLQADNYTLVSGSTMSEIQKYEYSPNPNGRKVVVTLRKNGRWVAMGQEMHSQGYYIGARRAYYDPSF